MKRNKIKKVWEKPKLIVLARSMPEENVLLGCKVKDLPGSTPIHPVSGNACTADPPGSCETNVPS